MCAGKWGRLRVTGASRSCRTPTFRDSAQSSSMCIRCASPHANCGVIKPARAIPCTPIYGKAILNPLKPVLPSVQLDTLPPLPRDEGGPVFAEPWQAQAFALAVKLSELGHFTWKEWAAELASELKAATNRGEPDDGTHYYEH